MAITTGERVFNRVQEGVEVTPGTAVTCTAALNGEMGSIPDLDRAEGAPQEDYGTIAERQPGRAYYGVRLAKFPFKGVVRFEDIMRFLEPGLCGGVVPTTPSAGVYLWTYTPDNTADTIAPRTLKFGDQITAYVAQYSIVEKIHLFFDALAAGQNAPWKMEVDYIARDLQGGTLDSVSNVGTAETPMGHLTRIFFGPVGTAYSSLSEVTGSLVKMDMTIETGLTTRKWGGGTDTFDAHGRLNRKVSFTGTVFATAAGKTTYRDPWATPNSSATQENRMRIQATGSLIASTYHKQLTIDTRAQIKAVKLGEHQGATIYEIEGASSNDATLASDMQIAIQNAVSAL